MRISDSIADYILKLLDQGDCAEIRRNELANTLGCVPSQINYVLTSRFTPEQGYHIESRRGGGGYIRITRVYHDPETAMAHIVHSIGDRLDGATARAILTQLSQAGALDDMTVNVISAALSDRALTSVPQEQRDRLRASLLKNMLVALH
ncbi:MAG: CtsR family transcriptional regulator [Oscillospiraceae bacterium]|nr:CtsR family transcriptional regulator [Oscillospiraceae bacterium]